MLKHIKSQEDWNEKTVGAKGFTLIELLVVIVILGILAAVVVFAVSGIADKGQKSACQAEASTVRSAAEAYAANNTVDGLYPATDANLVPGFLSKAPTLVTYTATNGAKAFTLAYGSKCSTISDVGAA
ncbi:MAG: ral secretion pathway protein [Acidimicrobiales bacterium]|nr:ral secretion pathway protein [Acidimicrobiales bacterium]